MRDRVKAVSSLDTSSVSGRGWWGCRGFAVRRRSPNVRAERDQTLRLAPLGPFVALDRVAPAPASPAGAQGGRLRDRFRDTASLAKKPSSFGALHERPRQHSAIKPLRVAGGCRSELPRRPARAIGWATIPISEISPLRGAETKRARLILSGSSLLQMNFVPPGAPHWCGGGGLSGGGGGARGAGRRQRPRAPRGARAC